MPTQDPENLIKALGEIINCFPYYATIIDEERRIHYANEVICSAVNIDMKEIIGHYCNQVIHGLDDPPKECPLIQSILTDKPQVNEYYSKDRDSWYSLEIYPLHIELNGKRMFLHLARDISKNKKLEETMIREKNIGEFYLDLLTHDISNMVQPLLSYLQMLNEIPEINMKYERFIKIPLEETERIKNLTRNVRKLSLVESNTLMIVTVYMKEEIEKCINDIMQRHPEKAINIIFTNDSYFGPINMNVEFLEPIMKICHQINKLNNDETINLYVTMIMNSDKSMFKLMATGDNEVFDRGFLDKYFNRYNDGVFRKEGLGFDITFYQELLRRLGGDIHLEPDLEREGKVKIVFTLPVENMNG